VRDVPQRHARVSTHLQAADRSATVVMRTWKIASGDLIGFHFRRRAQKPYYTIGLTVLEPRRFGSHVISSL